MPLTVPVGCGCCAYVRQADPGDVLLRSPPSDSFLVSSSTGPLDGPASVRSDAPPPTPGMSAMIDSTVDEPESLGAGVPQDGSEVSYRWWHDPGQLEGGYATG